MTELVIFYCTVKARIGENKFQFTGIGSTVEDAHNRAIRKLREDEYLKCVHYRITNTHFGIM